MALDFGKLNFSVSFNPTSAFPLDARSYFESYEAAEIAAASAEDAGSALSVYYYGQTIAVVEDGAATLYTIQPDKTLAEVGGKIEINEKVFAHDIDGKLNLYGFANAVAGAQLVKASDGTLSWVKPDTTTVEGLATTVDQLRKDVDSLEAALGATNANIGDVADRVSTLEDRVDQHDIDIAAKANAVDVYTKTETDNRIATELSKVDHLQRKIVNSIADINVGAADASKYIYMVPKQAGASGDGYDEYMVINGVLEKVGDWGVDLSEYIKEVRVAGTILTETNGSVNIPKAGVSQYGVVTSSAADNKISIDMNGTMEVNAINANKLVQDNGAYLILNGGNAIL